MHVKKYTWDGRCVSWASDRFPLRAPRDPLPPPRSSFSVGDVRSVQTPQQPRLKHLRWQLLVHWESSCTASNLWTVPKQTSWKRSVFVKTSSFPVFLAPECASISLSVKLWSTINWHWADLWLTLFPRSRRPLKKIQPSITKAEPRDEHFNSVLRWEGPARPIKRWADHPDVRKFEKLSKCQIFRRYRRFRWRRGIFLLWHFNFPYFRKI
jgi:hypothetical protein